MNLLTIAAHGFGLHDLALAFVRAAVGQFFAFSGYHKLFNKGRHYALLATLTKDHVPLVKFLVWWVPFWELTAGVMLTVGFLTAFSAGVLAIICVVACYCEAADKVERYKPIDLADRIDDWLYLPEVLYLVMLAVSILAGTGRFSLDAMLFPI
jgi:uncharacterized membrane protein YphA (DoxX/SURF4 family)